MSLNLYTGTGIIEAGSCKLEYAKTSQKPYARFTFVSRRESYRDPSKSEVAYLNCTAFGPLAERAYAAQGSELFIVGRFKTEEYEHQGQPRRKLTLLIEELKCLSNEASPAGSTGYQTAADPTDPAAGNVPRAAAPRAAAPTDDEPPF